MSANLCAYKCICSFLFCICVFLFYILCIFALYWGSPSGHVSIYVCIFVFAYFYSAFVYFYFVFLYFCTVLGKHQVGMSAYMCAYLYLHIPILYLCNFIFYVCIFSLYWGRTRWACLHICVNICIYVFLFCICVILFSIFVFLHCTGEAPGGHVCISVWRATRKGESAANHRLTTEIFVKHFQMPKIFGIPCIFQDNFT